MGSTPEAYFVGPRLNDSVTLNLAAQSASSLILPDVDGTVPQFLVPSHTTSVKATVSASAPRPFSVPAGPAAQMGNGGGRVAPVRSGEKAFDCADFDVGREAGASGGREPGPAAAADHP